MHRRVAVTGFGIVSPLGCTPDTEQAWWASMENILGLLDEHFHQHDFLLGGQPSLGDFGLLGPLYAHLFRDATAGFMLRTGHPIVAEWVERCNGTNVEARSYDQKLYSLNESGELVGRPATSDGGERLGNDEVPNTLDAVVSVFFDEMWPMLVSTMQEFREGLTSISIRAFRYPSTLTINVDKQT